MSSHYSLRANLRALPRPAWILFAGTFINRFGAFVLPFLVIYLTRQGYSAAQAGIAASAYGAGHLIGSMLGGHLADRIGRRETIALSMFASAAAMIVLSQARAYPAILAITLFAGAAAEMYRPAAGALIGDLVPQEQRVTAFAMFRFALNLGFAAGPATAGLLADRSFLLLFLGDAVTSLACGVITLVALPRGTRSQAKQERAGGAIRHALKDEPFLLFLLATLCITWIEYQVHTTFPLYLQAAGYSAKTYGFLISLNGVLIVLFELALTGWTQRRPPQAVIALGYALFGIGFALSGLAPVIPVLILSVVVWTVGEMVFAPVTGAYVTDLAPEQYRGGYHGLWVLMWSIGMLLGPSLGTLLFQRNANVYWIAVACAGLAGAGLALVKRRTSPS
jgi:MFS family permease